MLPIARIMGKALLLLWCLTLGLMTLAGLSILQHQKQLTLLLHPALLTFALWVNLELFHPHTDRAPWHKGVPGGPAGSSTHYHLPDHSRDPRWWVLGKHGERVSEVNHWSPGIKGKMQFILSILSGRIPVIHSVGECKEETRQAACIVWQLSGSVVLRTSCLGVSSDLTALLCQAGTALWSCKVYLGFHQTPLYMPSNISHCQ